MAQFASDAFGGTEGDELSTYSGSWAKSPGVTGDFEISSGRLRASSTTSPAYYHSATPASADYTVSIDLYKITQLGNYVGVLGRTSTSVQTHYNARVDCNGASGGTMQLYKFVSGSATQLGSNTGVTYSTTTNTELLLDMVGTAIKVYFNGSGTPSISVTDGSITDAGKAGIRAFSSTAPTDSNGIHLDNFSADEASGVTGTGALTTGTTTASGTGTVAHTGTGSLTANAVTASGTGTLTHTGTGSLTVGATTLAGDGTVSAAGSVTGTGAITVGAVTASGSGVLTHTGTGAATVSNVTASGTGTLTHTGTGDLNTNVVTLSASGFLGSGVTGTGSLTVGNVEVSGTGTWYGWTPQGGASGTWVDAANENDIWTQAAAAGGTWTAQ